LKVWLGGSTQKGNETYLRKAVSLHLSFRHSLAASSSAPFTTISPAYLASSTRLQVATLGVSRAGLGVRWVARNSKGMYALTRSSRGMWTGLFFHRINLTLVYECS